MAAELERVAAAAAAAPADNEYLSKERVLWFQQQSQRAKSPQEKLWAESQLALSLLNAGENERSIQVLDRYQRALKHYLPGQFQQMMPKIGLLIGLGYLRIGERENCQHNHSAASCLFPIQSDGVHQHPQGSRSAKQIFSQLLQRFPEDQSARWLNNIAHMTLGEYPHGVAPEWLIPPTCFETEADSPRFPDIATPLGVDVDGLCGGSVVDDFNNDSNLDIVVSSFGLRDPLRIFWNTGNGGFQEGTETAGLTGQVGGLNFIHADYNNDGYLDLFVLRGGWFGKGGKHPNSLLRNNGDGTFTDVTKAAGVLSYHPTQTAVWFDYDRDGHLDLFVGNESTEAGTHPCELFRNNGDGTFTEIAAETGLNLTRFVKGVVSADYDNDGWADLYLSCLGQPNLLMHNEPNGSPTGMKRRFQNRAPSAGVSEPVDSFPTWFWDYDNDGWEDLFVAGYRLENIGDMGLDYMSLPHGSEKARLYRNLGDGSFEDVTASAGLSRLLHAMGANYGDLDNDGYLDCYLGTGDSALVSIMPNRMFRNNQGAGFQDITSAGGFGHLQKGHGVSFGDWDNDGDQDVHTVMGGAYPSDHFRNALFANPGTPHPWLKLLLEPKTGSASPIGARIQVDVEDPSGKLRSIHRTVSSGGSFGGNPFRLEIGLGAAAAIRSVRVLWPGTHEAQEWNGLKVKRLYRLVEKKSAPIETPLPEHSMTELGYATEAHGSHH